MKELKEVINFDIELSAGNKIYIKIGNVTWSGEAYVGLLDEDKIRDDSKKGEVDIRVLSLAPISYLYDFDDNVALTFYIKFNDNLAHIVEKSEGMFIGLAGVPLQSPSLAIDELKRAVKDLGLKGVEIGSHVLGKNLDDESLRDFFRIVSALNIPVFVHPQITDVIGKDRLRKYFFTNILGVPIEDTIAGASLIASGIIQEYDIKVILPHGGGFLPYQIGRFDNGYKIRSDVREKIRKEPSSFLSNFYFDTILFNKNIIEFLVKFVGSDHLVLGSDYPFKMGYFKPYESVEFLSEIDKEKICETNARKLFKI
jgi:aminocarboxymuconate-semialdehyde decarboxylase